MSSKLIKRFNATHKKTPKAFSEDNEKNPKCIMNLYYLKKILQSWPVLSWFPKAVHNHAVTARAQQESTLRVQWNWVKSRNKPIHMMSFLTHSNGRSIPLINIPGKTEHLQAKELNWSNIYLWQYYKTWFKMIKTKTYSL